MKTIKKIATLFVLAIMVFNLNPESAKLTT